MPKGKFIYDINEQMYKIELEPVSKEEIEGVKIEWADFSEEPKD